MSQRSPPEEERVTSILLAWSTFSLLRFLSRISFVSSVWLLPAPHVRLLAGSVSYTTKRQTVGGLSPASSSGSHQGPRVPALARDDDLDLALLTISSSRAPSFLFFGSFLPCLLAVDEALGARATGSPQNKKGKNPRFQHRLYPEGVCFWNGFRSVLRWFAVWPAQGQEQEKTGAKTGENGGGNSRICTH
jgi:hypothetical protein